jgi:signal transduction histidine kinase
MKQLSKNIDNIKQLTAILSSAEIIEPAASAISTLIYIYTAITDETWLQSIGDKIQLSYPNAQIIGAITCGEILNGETALGQTVIHFTFFTSTQSHPFVMPIKAGEVITQLIYFNAELNHQLLLAKEKATQQFKTKLQFLETMSHEMRTPLAAIMGFSDLALLNEMPANIYKYIKKISTASHHLYTIINDTLDLSRLEARKINLKLNSFVLADLHDSLHDLLINTAQAKGLTLNIDIRTDIPKALVGDKLRITQILLNLLGNALKCTHQGSVTLSIRLLQLTATEAQLLFAVLDTGIGISTEQQDKIRQLFSQLDEGFYSHFEGSGLGLAISQNLVQLMGGRIELTSSLDLGSCFSFKLTLPLADLTITEPQVTIPLATLRGVRILVVEDNAYNQLFISDLLEHLGTCPVLANNGIEALAVLEQQVFDIILMDLHMPVMNGYETTQEIRKQPSYAQLPVIAFSANVTEESKRRCLASGMNDFISKPTNKKDLLATLDRWLKR